MQAPPLGKRVLDPNSFFLYVANHRNTTEGMSVVHNALWARRYAKFAEQAGLNYAAYCEGTARLQEVVCIWQPQ